MAIDTSAIGKEYEPLLYAVGREKVGEYARAVGEKDPLYLDVAAARSAGYADVVAPPMFAAVYCGPAIERAMFDPDVGIDFGKLVHGAQRFEWGPLVVAGDEISTVVEVESIEERRGNGIYIFGSSSRNQRDEVVCVGTWTNYVRAAD
ncbi:MAG TPA: MaoC family dehydratase N-terminal domain-containing protein [Baekduia sp.]|nr:MaoC family dehydratase N-terminal domain-containing protein [Baekduia sp.]